MMDVSFYDIGAQEGQIWQGFEVTLQDGSRMMFYDKRIGAGSFKWPTIGFGMLSAWIQ